LKNFKEERGVELNLYFLFLHLVKNREMRNDQLCSNCNLISWNPQEGKAVFNVPGQGVYSVA